MFFINKRESADMNALSLEIDYKSSKSFLSSVFDKVDTGIILSDLKGHVLEANPFFFKYSRICKR